MLIEINNLARDETIKKPKWYFFARAYYKWQLFAIDIGLYYQFK